MQMKFDTIRAQIYNKRQSKGGKLQKNIITMEWHKFNGDPIEGSIQEAVKQTIIKETVHGQKLKVCIGSDSQVKGGITEFATVIVFLREKRGGFMFIQNDKSSQHFTIKERMLAEVTKSIAIAYQLCPILEEFHVDMEVHADINTNPSFNSNTALKEAMGYILGMGFCFKAKPEAFASSCCADKVI
jgi:predicted RNase H-related nuclease YkuK (DUF458 family)